MATWSILLPDYTLIAENGERRVVVREKLKKVQAKVDDQHRLTIRNWMRFWVNDGPQDIPPEKFKFQQRFNQNGFKPVVISAFKSYQARYYGFSRVVDGKMTFFVTAIDPAKKDDKANDEVLERASREAFRVLKALKIQ